MYDVVFSEFLADLCWQNRISYQKPSWTPIDWVIEWAFCTEYNQSKWNYKIHVNFMFYCTLYLIIGSNKNKKKRWYDYDCYTHSRVLCCASLPTSSCRQWKFSLICETQCEILISTFIIDSIVHRKSGFIEVFLRSFVLKENVNLRIWPTVNIKIQLLFSVAKYSKLKCDYDDFSFEFWNSLIHFSKKFLIGSSNSLSKKKL